MSSFIRACASYAAVVGFVAAFLWVCGWDDEVSDWLEERPLVGVSFTIGFMIFAFIWIDSAEKAAKLEYENKFKGTRRSRK